MKKRPKAKDARIETPGLFLLVVLGLFVSVAVIVYGIFSYKPGNVIDTDSQNSQEEEEKREEPLSVYFKKNVNTQASIDADDEFIIGDPFIDVCADTAGDELPAISTGTVCLR